MSRVRIALPPLETLTAHTEFEFARLDHQGHVSQTGISCLEQLGRDAKSLAVDCFLHPADSVLTRIELPPLSAARVGAAVTCAAQALILGGSERMHIAHSARDGGGHVHLGWLPKIALERFGQLLSQHRLKLRGLYPAPYALPIPPAGQVCACVLDGQLLLRFSLEQAAVEPLVQDRLDELAASGDGVLWMGEGAPDAVLERHPADQRWSGTPPGWGLHGGIAKTTEGAPGWGRAVFCCALAIGIWVLGLNLYAAREAALGQQLKWQMSQRVKQAFPELPVILNPLQQARQQLAARHGGAAPEANQGFDYMVQQAANALPFMAGNVQRLTFDKGRLQLESAAETGPATADGAVQVALSQAGLSASREENVWTLSPLAEAAADDRDTATMENDDE